MKTYTYKSNNSGGSWWLDDNNWLALEKAGWKVEWVKNETDRTWKDKDGRWLGALATTASKEFASLDAAIDEFERIAEQDYGDAGCECCGSPHWIDEE